MRGAHAQFLRAYVCVCACIVALPSTAAASVKLVVGFENRTSTAAEVSTLKQVGVAQSSALLQLDVRVITVADGSAAKVMKRLRTDSDVQYVSKVTPIKAMWSPSDPFIINQWGMTKIGAQEAWDVSRGSDTVTVAIVDSGIDRTHPDLSLAGHVLTGKDFVQNDLNPNDENGHGTLVAGVVGATADNRIGVAGLAPNVKLLPVRVLDARGQGNSVNMAAGVVWAADQGAKVINLSLGSPSPMPEILDAMNYAAGKGAVITCAAGNDARSVLHYPAAYAPCMAVGATAQGDTRAWFSAYGPGIDVVAPGVEIWSTSRYNRIESANGTSVAAPFVAGLAALLSSQGLAKAAIETRIKDTAKDLGAVGYDNVFGFGRINAAAALALDVVPPPPAPPGPPPPPPPDVLVAPVPNPSAPKCVSALITTTAVASETDLQCSDRDGHDLRYSITTTARNGTATVDAITGELTYTPNNGYRGLDRVTFKATDGGKVGLAYLTFKVV